MALFTLWAILVIPVILFGNENGSEAYDQNHHHLVVIQQASDAMAGRVGAKPLGELLADYPSATSPGYHLWLASLQKVGIVDVTALRLVSSLFGLGLVLILWRAMSVRLDPWLSFWLSLPILCSPYFLAGSQWLTTDVAALAFVVGAVAVILARNGTKEGLATIGLGTTLAVWIRQPSVWLLGPAIAMAAVDGRGRWTKVQWAVWMAGMIAPVVLLGWLIWMWGGLVPPGFRDQHNHGANLATPAVFLALTALWSAPWWAPRLLASGIPRSSRSWIGVGALVGFLLAMVSATNYNRDAGRWGGPVWEAIRLLPAPGGVSLLVAVGSVVGGAAVAVGLLALRNRVGWRGAFVAAVLACSLIAALSANSQCFERYMDLPLLAFIPLALSLVAGEGDRSHLRRGAIALALVQGALSVVMVFLPAISPAR